MPKPPADPAALARQVESIERVARATPPAPSDFMRLGRALRQLSRWMLGTEDAGQIARAAAVLEDLVGELQATKPPPSRFTRELAENPDERLVNAWGKHPLLGSSHPLAPPIEMRVEPDRLVGDVTFDVRFEGNAGWVHGGFIAAGFDIVAVQAARLSGRSGPTGTLSVRYLAPTPVGVPLRYEGFFDREAGRKLFTTGQLLRTDTGAVTATAETIVIAPAAEARRRSPEP